MFNVALYISTAVYWLKIMNYSYLVCIMSHVSSDCVDMRFGWSDGTIQWWKNVNGFDTIPDHDRQTDRQMLYTSSHGNE